MDVPGRESPLQSETPGREGWSNRFESFNLCSREKIEFPCDPAVSSGLVDLPGGDRVLKREADSAVDGDLAIRCPARMRARTTHRPIPPRLSLIRPRRH